MMYLPNLPYVSSPKKSFQTGFGGYNHTLGAGDGEIYDMLNLTSDHYPVLSSRDPRYKKTGVNADNGIFYINDEQYRANGAGFYHNDTLVGTVADSEKKFANINNKIIIWPDKKYFNMDSLKSKGTYATLAILEASVTAPAMNDIYLVGTDTPYAIYYWSGQKWVQNKYTFGALDDGIETEGPVTFLARGELFGIDADANTIYIPDIQWENYFSVGDAITISGCKLHPENNKTAIIREIDGDYLRFYENTFICDEKLVYTEQTDGLSLGDENTKYKFQPSMWIPAVMPSDYCFCFSDLEPERSYCFTYGGVTYYFTNATVSYPPPLENYQIKNVGFFYFINESSYIEYYSKIGHGTISVSTTTIEGAEELTVVAGDGATKTPLSILANNTWYTFTVSNDIEGMPSIDIFDYFVFNLADLKVYRYTKNGHLVETATAKRGKDGININNITNIKLIDGINFYFDTDTERIVFDVNNPLLRGEKLTWDENTLTQDNFGTIPITVYNLLDVSYIGEGEYTSEINTWSAGNYCIEAGDDTIYFTVADEEISETDEGYFTYDGAKVTYYNDTATSSEEIFSLGVSVDKKLFFMKKPVDYIEQQELSSTSVLLFQREVPDMDFLLGHHNRIWGCKGDKIYASKLGDPFNFNVFEGLSTDSFVVESGTPGDFTAAFSYLGYPLFFKENSIIKMYGDRPADFQAYNTATNGVAAGSDKSLAIAGETLYYHNKAGIMAYTGGIPSLVSPIFGNFIYKNGVGGSDGMKYYVDLTDSLDSHHLFVYDPLRNLWMKEDTDGIICFVNFDGELWAYDGDLITMSARSAPIDTTEEADVEWSMETADITGASPNKKGISGFQIRCEVTGSMSVSLKCDGGDWVNKYSCEDKTKQTLLIPIIPQRADHYRLKLEGTGEVKLFGLAIQYYDGSEL